MPTTASLPTFLPLPEAAAKFGMTEAILYERVQAGTIAAGILSDGEIVVSKDNILTTGAHNINDRLSAIKREDFEHLRGHAITVTEAAVKYGEKYGIKVIGQTIRDWVKRGYIRVLRESTGRGSYLELDEADVAYCVAIHTIRKQARIRTGFSLLDEDGRPGLLKHPSLSRYRREQRKTSSQ